MNKAIRWTGLRAILAGTAVAFWTTAAGLAAPSVSALRAVASNHQVVAESATASPDGASIDTLYAAMERLAQALHSVNLPNASGGMPRLRGYIDAEKLADEVLGIATTLRDQNSLSVASHTAVPGPDDGRAGVLTDLLGHFNEFSAILDRLDGAQHGNDEQSRFNALVDLARLLDVEAKNKPGHKFNPGTVLDNLRTRRRSVSRSNPRPNSRRQQRRAQSSSPQATRQRLPTSQKLQRYSSRRTSPPKRNNSGTIRSRFAIGSTTISISFQALDRRRIHSVRCLRAVETPSIRARS